MKNIKSEISNKNLKSALKNIMNFGGIGFQRKEEMFFNIIMPFMMVYSKDGKVKNFLKFLFENYPPLRENRIVKSFKFNYSKIKIENLKTYMGVILFQNQKQAAV